MRRERICFGLIMLVGLCLRLALGVYRPSDLTSDNDGYLAHAHPFAEGRGYLGPYSDRPTAFRPPAYPVALGILIAIGCSDRVAVAVISAVSSVLILWLTKTLAQQSGLTLHFQFLAVSGVALDPLLVRYAVLPMTEVPCTAVLLAAVLLFRSTKEYGRPENRRAVIAGVLFGLGTLIRPVILISCVFLSLHRFLRVARVPPTGATSTIAARCRILLPGVVAGLVLLPWVVRNAVQLQSFVPATTHGGYTLALGNNPNFYRDVINGDDDFPWNGAALDAWQRRMIDQSKESGVEQVNEPASDEWYYQQAFAAIRAEPASFLKAVALRLRRFWALTAAESQTGVVVSAVIGVWYVLIWIGLVWDRLSVFWLRKTGCYKSLTDLWLVVLSFMLMHSVYWTDARMRAPIMPILIVLSLSGWQSIVNWCRCHQGVSGTNQ